MSGALYPLGRYPLDMESVYPIHAWSRSSEDEIIKCIQEVYARKGFMTKNFHANDRVHEQGTDLECMSGKEKIAFAVKRKPRKRDIKQLRTFAKATQNGRGIYVFIQPPTRPFEHVAQSIDTLAFWDAFKLHKELIEGESISYLCLLFSAHPIADTLTKIIEIVYNKRRTSFEKRKLTSQELDKLWVAKDNIVKMRAMLLNVYTRWTKKLMTKSARVPEEYEAILDEVFEELDVVKFLCGEKLTTSFEEIASRHPDLFGLFWENIRQRTNWKLFTVAIEKIPMERISDFIHLWWVLPRLDKSTVSVMRGFYSAINYILQNFHTVTKNLEDGVDWVFEDMR